MRTLTPAEIIAAFPPKWQKKLKLPKLENIPWDNLDFFGWLHPSGHLGYVVYDDGRRLRGLMLERTKPQSKARRAKMCSWCKAVHPRVELFTTSILTQKDKVVGDYFCSDLQCSLRIRGHFGVDPNQMRETIDLDARILRLAINLETFFERVYSGVSV